MIHATAPILFAPLFRRRPARRLPSYRLHKASGHAVVTLKGKDVYLGWFGTPESTAAYDRVIAEWLARGRRPPADAPGNIVTIATVLEAFDAHADGTTATSTAHRPTSGSTTGWPRGPCVTSSVRCRRRSSAPSRWRRCGPR